MIKLTDQVFNTETEIKLASVMDVIRKIEKDKIHFQNNLKIGFLRNYTIEGIEPFLKLHLYNAKINPQVLFGGYDTVIQEILDPDSHIYKTQFDVITLSLVIENFDTDFESLYWTSNESIKKIDECFNLLFQKTNSIIIVNTFIPPFYNPIGITNSDSIPDKINEVSKINQHIREYVRQHRAQFFLVDFERIIRLLGEEKTIDYRFWYTSKALFKKDFLNAYAQEIVKIAKALKGRTKKCLVLDCDNTLWGGIIGEDGISGIKLDKHIYPDKLYYEFQQNVINLHERGIIIALCSKNNEEDVWEILDNHPSCLLKRRHVAAWRINWDDKSSNIKSIANELNLGIDSFVFVDDSPLECELVKKMLPDVTVLQVPQKLYTYPKILLHDGWFDTLHISEEDKNRTQMYKADNLRKIDEKSYGNIDEYLSSLDITAIVHEVTDSEIVRVAQLTQKTNQFNLTTRRYSEPDINGFVEDPLTAVFSLTVKDKFGDSGLTGVLIAYRNKDRVTIDNMLLSCRILGRKIEIAFVDYCLRYLVKKWDCIVFEAEYIPSPKNKQTLDFWLNFGFKEIKNDNDGKRYLLNFNEYKKHNIGFISIEDN